MNPHQHRVIQMKLEGLSATEIAERLKVKEGTIRYHITKAYKVLGCPGGKGLERIYLEYRKLKGLSDPIGIKEFDGKVYRLTF